MTILTAEQAWKVADRLWRFWDRDELASWKVADTKPAPLRFSEMPKVSPTDTFTTIRFDREFVGRSVIITSPDFPGWRKRFDL